MSYPRKIWSGYVHARRPKCIYSGLELKSSNMSLDHFIPWSYVAHNQICNLVPVPMSPNINSSKGNCLPSYDYVSKFIELQYAMLVFQRESCASSRGWHSFIAPYWELLRLSEEEILNRNEFSRAMEMVILQQMGSAERLGFASGWSYL